MAAKGGKEVLYIGIFAVAAAGFIFFWYSGKKTEPTVVTPDAGAASAIQNEDARDILSAIEIIKSIDLEPLDTKFFEDPRFVALKDTSVVIPKAVPVRRAFNLSAE